MALETRVGKQGLRSLGPSWCWLEGCPNWGRQSRDPRVSTSAEMTQAPRSLRPRQAPPSVTSSFPRAPPPPPGTNVCAVANGGCQQLCLYRGGGQRACACAHGMLAEDGASCREYAGYLLYSERTILKSIHLSDERNLNAPVQAFEDSKHMKNVIALAFDYRAGTSPGTPNRIFFSDIHFGNIQQINDDGSGRTTIVESEPRFQIFQGSGGWW